MIVGIGNDIVEIERIKKACEKPSFLTKYFKASELELFESRHMNPETIAANFSAKEAVSKVFGTGIKGFDMKDIEILRTAEGRPYIQLYNNAKKISEKLEINQWHITISHSKSMVSVVVVGEKDDNSKK